MPTTPRRFYNIKDCLHGAVAVNTVQSVTINRNWTRLAGQGDNDIGDTFQAKTNYQCNGSIVIQDPIQADALLDAASGTLAFNGITSAGGTEKEVTIVNVEFFSTAETDAHNALDTITLNWNAMMGTGGVDPYSVALAA